MIETEGLTHIHLRVQDIDASLAFYQQVFGMQEVFRDGDLVFLNTPGSKTPSLSTLTTKASPAKAAESSTSGFA